MEKTFLIYVKSRCISEKKLLKVNKPKSLPAILPETAKAKKATTEKVLMIILRENQD